MFTSKCDLIMWDWEKRNRSILLLFNTKCNLKCLEIFTAAFFEKKFFYIARRDLLCGFCRPHICEYKALPLAIWLVHLNRKARLVKSHPPWILTSRSFRLFSSLSSSPPTHTFFPSKEETSPLPTHSVTLLLGLILLTTRVSSSPQQKLTPMGWGPKEVMELAKDIARHSKRSLVILQLAKKKS